MYLTGGTEERKVVIFNRSLEIPRSAMRGFSHGRMRADYPYFGDRMRPPNKPLPQRSPPKRNRLAPTLFWHSIESEIQLQQLSTIPIDSFVISGSVRQPNSSTSSKITGGFPSGLGWERQTLS